MKFVPMPFWLFRQSKAKSWNCLFSPKILYRVCSFHCSSRHDITSLTRLCRFSWQLVTIPLSDYFFRLLAYGRDFWADLCDLNCPSVGLRYDSSANPRGEMSKKDITDFVCETHSYFQHFFSILFTMSCTFYLPLYYDTKELLLFVVCAIFNVTSELIADRPSSM